MLNIALGARSRTRILGALIVSTMSVLGSSLASAQNIFKPGEILVSASTYAGNSSTIVVGQTVLPGAKHAGTKAVANGSYPTFTNNDSADSNFGITSPLSIIEINPVSGNEDYTFNLTAANGMVTSFTSKSEGSLNLSTDGTAVSVMGYDPLGSPGNTATLPYNLLDISNSNTPADANGATNTANPTYRAITQINANGTGYLTDVNDYAGDNPRAAVLAINNHYYMVGNTGDKTSPNSQIYTGAQIVTPGLSPTNYGNTISLGSFNITQNGDPADSVPKDNNFRGATIFNNTLYVAKGSGSNGIDTVYQVGNIGSLPTGPAGSNAISILPGFNTLPASADDSNTTDSDFTHPFGLWFANATTLYVGDEGSGIYSDITTLAANPSSKLVNGQEFGGIDKYSLVNGVWTLDYVISAGLNIGTGGENGQGQYTVTGTTPGGDSGSYVVESTGGLRDITGVVNGDGTVTIYGITSTVSTNADQGADPNKVVKITDKLSYTAAAQASGESFTTLQTAVYGQVFRGVSLTPSVSTDTPTMPVWGLLLLAVLLVGVAIRFLPRKVQT
jgi:uncharacterized protein YegP (UPF0339 family)